MKITHCIYSFNTGGAETMLIDILNEQVKCNKVSLIILNKSYDFELLNLINKNVDIYLINRPCSSKNPWYILKLNYRIISLKSDILHMHNLSISSLIFCSKEKMVATVHDMGISSRSFVDYNALFAISKAVYEDIKLKGDFTIYHVSNGITINALEKKQTYQTNPEKSTFKIVQVARLQSDKKGQDILINAIKLLQKEGIVDIHVDFIGTGPSEYSLKKLVSSLDLGNNISFLGIKDRAYIYEHLKDYDLLVHPSRFEGFGLTVVEAMAAKLPVLVASGDGPSEIIENGKYGEVFENNNIQDCVLKLKKIINDYNLSISKIDDAFVHVKNSYSIKSMTDKYYSVYITIKR